MLLADGRQDNLAHVAGVLTRLGHRVVGMETDLARVAALTERESPDLAIVVVGESSEHALGLIRLIVREATCPVIAVLDVEDAAFVERAADCGIFAYIANGEVEGERLESAMAVVLRRFAEYHALEGAFGRRAVTERAKGVLMERHSIGEDAAFQMLRDQSRQGGRKLIDVAQAVLDARPLLPGRS